MANPTRSDVTISPSLTNISIAFVQREDSFVARRAYPTVPVQKDSAEFFQWSREDLMRSDARKRAPGAPSVEGGQDLTTTRYFTDRRAIKRRIPDPIRANADPSVNLDRNATTYVTQQLLLSMEKDWVTEQFSTGSGWDGASSSTNMTGLKSPTSTSSNFLRWNDIASTPIEDIEGEKESIAQGTGLEPNTLILGRKVWTALKNHPDILDRIKFTERGIVTTDLLASLLDLDRVMVANAVENTAAEGSSEGTFSFVAGNNALLMHVAANPGIETATAGYTFIWTGGTGIPPEGIRIKRYRGDEEKESDVIEGESWWDFKQVSSALGAFFASAASTS